MESSDKNFFSGIQPNFTFAKVGENNNNSNNNNNNSSNNKAQLNAQRFGLKDLPPNVTVFEIEFDMGLVKSIDDENKPLIINILNYIAYDIAKTADDVAVRTYVAMDLNDAENVRYQISATFLTDVTFDISMIVDQLRTYSPLKIRDNIKLYFDNKQQRHVLEIPVNKNPLKTVKMSQTMIHYHGPLVNYSYDSVEERDVTKRKRGNG